MTVAYEPQTDVLTAEIFAHGGEADFRAGCFSVWWTSDGTIAAVHVHGYLEQVGRLRRARPVVRLGGIAPGVRVSEKDIREMREELLSALERRW
jgi:hypothetical protein